MENKYVVPKPGETPRAVILSIICPGLGQINNGQLLKGILFGPIALLMISEASNLLSIGYNLLSVLLLAILAWFVLPAVDAFKVSRQNVRNGQKRKYFWLVSVVFFLISVSNIKIARSLASLEYFREPASSMMPFVSRDEKFLVDKSMRQSPARGDVFVFLYPKDKAVHFVKRLVGLPGDKIEIKNKVLYINDKESVQKPVEDNAVFISKLKDSQYSSKTTLIAYDELTDEDHHIILEDSASTSVGVSYGPTQVPADSYFFIGDNRDFSNDSRFWGFVPKEDLVGKVVHVFHRAIRQTN